MHPHVQALICSTFEGRSIGMALALAHMRALVTDSPLDATLIEPLAGLCQRCLSDMARFGTGEVRALFPDVWAVVRLYIQVARDTTTFTIMPLIGAPSFSDQWRDLYPPQVVVMRLQPHHRGALVCHV
jgi:hypothetical protein